MSFAELIRRFQSYVPQRFRHSAFARGFFAFYHSLILFGVAHGVYKGIQSFVLWRRQRQPIKLTQKTLEPIINASIDAGYLGYYIFWTGVLSGFVVATAPISVPIIIQTMREKRISQQEKMPEKSEEKDSKGEAKPEK